ncbi:hypothetical protein NQ314_007429 [Rhamnusium bicolor]|uniref:Uncharacterized protein n=1 Tax=Rhamnusium bicolor TaxID=1586634 RepID=A0AAV8YQP9_9CUCU|nr:hypothetical protein NQ314_007429 [Rhamnusium bicolor]
MTSANSEVSVRTPILKGEFLSTTPTYNWTESSTTNITSNDYVVVTSKSSNVPAISTELDTQFTATEEFTESSRIEDEEDEFEDNFEENNGASFEGFFTFFKNDTK